jgi:two-component system KDP operon response regulator KdpE
MVKKRVLIADDELSIIKFLRATLIARGYEVLTAIDGAEALQVFESNLPDLAILDITMPRMDGFEVCRRLREWTQVPIIMLSARGDEADKVKCLKLGADDYLTKPFGIEELMARIEAVMRRVKTQSTAKPTFTCDNITINFPSRQVTVSGKEVQLTPTEYNLLQELVLNANKVLTHGMLLNKVWGPEYNTEKEYLRVFIGRLRKALELDPANPRYLLTIPGVGYMFKVPTTPMSGGKSKSI